LNFIPIQTKTLALVKKIAVKIIIIIIIITTHASSYLSTTLYGVASERAVNRVKIQNEK
jgi:hypothetical protein